MPVRNQYLEYLIFGLGTRLEIGHFGQKYAPFVAKILWSETPGNFILVFPNIIGNPAL